MAEENLPVVEDTVVQETHDEPELSPVEQKALEMGWRPKEEWTGEEDDFISAETFVARKPLFDRIEHQNKELKQVKQALNALQEHHLKVKEIAVQEAYDKLKAEKREALIEGDADKVIELDEKLADLRERERSEKAQLQAPSQTINEDFAVWVEKNKWYVDSSKKELRDYADTAGVMIAHNHPGYTPAQILKEVEKQVKMQFKEHFTNERKNQPSAVEGSTSRNTGRASKESLDLSDDEVRVMNKILRVTPGLTKEQYLKELKAIKEKGN